MATDASADLKLFLAKLERFAPLSNRARDAFLKLPAQVREYPENSDVTRERSDKLDVFFIQSGLLSRYKTLQNGSRQTVSFDIPGDLTGLEYALVRTSDHGIRTHCKARIVTVANTDLLNLAARHFELAQAFWSYAVADAASLREWIVNVGRRDARGRTAHLLLELAIRHQSANLVVGWTFHFPVIQQDLADALGITAVHLNRVLQWMRNQKLISTDNRSITINNARGLEKLSGFDGSYLQANEAKYMHSQGRSTSSLQANFQGIGQAANVT
jgi:CRP-like cAMP-binding protein